MRVHVQEIIYSSPRVSFARFSQFHYYQVDVLKQQIFSTVLQIMIQCQGSEVTDPCFLNAVDSLFAIEANIPETEVPDWPEATLTQLFLFFIQYSVEGDSQRRGAVTSSPFEAFTIFTYKPNNGMKDLSHKTLRRCFESLSLRFQQTLPQIDNPHGMHSSTLRWPKLSTHLSTHHTCPS
jgi:hypothetical protein